MNSFEIKYKGNLRTSARHIDSGAIIETDAPKDNYGLGETFSPTDLVCVSLASCMLTIMGISMQKHQVSIKGTTAKVKKTMKLKPRMIGQIDITIYFPEDYSEKIKQILKKSALSCPVHRSLSPEIEKNIQFIYPA
tara:strand:+ start:103 stop:510 length:408 start_codon:yes stop_codon:yes gene_type:complete